jgi:hypothetical protein
VASSDIVTYIGFGEGNFPDGFDVAGSSLNGTYTFQVTKSGGDGTAGITNPVIVNVLVEDLPLCGQHSAIVAPVDSSACSLDLSVVVSDGTDDTALFTVGSTSRPPGVAASTTTTYIGLPEGTFAFDNFSVGPGDSLNGTYTFTVDDQRQRHQRQREPHHARVRRQRPAHLRRPGDHREGHCRWLQGCSSSRC